jgi:tagaturonate reductase
MKDEIVPAIINDKISKNEAESFAASVLDRYSNPFLEHQWLSITVQYSLKMKGRNLDTLKWYLAKTRQLPTLMATGFAAYLLFMRSSKNADNTYSGFLNGKSYIINDQHAGLLYELWRNNEGKQLVEAVLSNTVLWDEPIDLSGFADAVYEKMKQLQETYGISAPSTKVAD